MNQLITFQTGYSKFILEELLLKDFNLVLSGDNYLLTDKKINQENPVFPHLIIDISANITGDSVNSIALNLTDFFINSIKDQVVNETIPIYFGCDSSIKGLARRMLSVKKYFIEQTAKRVSRVSKFLSEDSLHQSKDALKGLFVFFNDFGSMHVGTGCRFFGQKRMSDDPKAPSRSYLKVEEAYTVFKKYPIAGDTVVDLGAAPGGWSYSAFKKGASVIAIDNGPLKGGAKDIPQITHLTMDAFKYTPRDLKKSVWLFCDMVIEPKHTLNLLQKWIDNRWCNHFIVNLKFGWTDPIQLINELRTNESLNKSLSYFKIIHLYHDREEITLLGSLA